MKRVFCAFFCSWFKKVFPCIREDETHYLIRCIFASRIKNEKRRPVILAEHEYSFYLTVCVQRKTTLLPSMIPATLRSTEAKKLQNFSCNKIFYHIYYNSFIYRSPLLTSYGNWVYIHFRANIKRSMNMDGRRATATHAILFANRLLLLLFSWIFSFLLLALIYFLYLITSSLCISLMVYVLFNDFHYLTDMLCSEAHRNHHHSPRWTVYIFDLMLCNPPTRKPNIHYVSEQCERRLVHTWCSPIYII